jgi:hypothetical protein
MDTHALSWLSQPRKKDDKRSIVPSSKGVHEHELKFIRGAVQRNQLTGSESFILHVERLTGERILQPSHGRPATNN